MKSHFEDPQNQRLKHEIAITTDVGRTENSPHNPRQDELCEKPKVDL